MFTIIVCLVLFDARGAILDDVDPSILLVAAAVLLAVKYIPAAIHRPRMVEAVCDDALAIAAHAACVLVVRRDQILQYACALHSICYLVQHRFNSLPALTAVALLLLAAHVYGPRISELKPFLIAMAFPTLAEGLATTLAYARRIAVVWVLTGGLLSSE